MEKRIDQLKLGSKVYASRSCGIAKAHEAGIVYEEYTLEGRKGVSIIFEQGGYDGFSPDDCELFIVNEGTVSAQAAQYQFFNVGRLFADYQAGLFNFKEHAPFEELERADIEKQIHLASSVRKVGL